MSTATAGECEMHDYFAWRDAPRKFTLERNDCSRLHHLKDAIVDLARRHRIANPAEPSGNGSRKRLHFRRGHWRHYESMKTWIRWCLAGDPDLGFIDKHYTL